MAENISIFGQGGGGGLSIQGAYGIELYIKGGLDYYRLTCLYNPKTSDGDISRVYSNDFVENQNLFEFTLTPKEGESGAASIPSQLAYSELFTLDDTTDFTGSEVYIRNDSPLHRYLSNLGYAEFINVLKPYLYFGKIYPKNEANSIIQIETYFMKDYALDALPEHQRTDNIREFFGVAFDELYSQLYYKIRDILRQSDPTESKGEYLHYLLETFGTTTIIPPATNGWDLDRFFIQNLPALLKRKGAYSALYGIFRFLTNTTNRLNIYEQWHELLPSGAPYTMDSIKDYCVSAGYLWQENLYDDYYTENAPISGGCGVRFYTDVDTYPLSSSDLHLSPHYRVEMDLATEPVKYNKILDSGTANIIVEKFNELKPVARYCTYSTVMKMVTDFTGRYMDSYNGMFTAFCKTKCLRPVYKPLPGCFVFHSRSLTATTFHLYHELGTRNILVQTYTDNGEAYEPPLNRFYPKNIIVIDNNNVEIELADPTPFYAFIASTDPTYGTATEIPSASLPTAELSTTDDPESIWTVWNRKIDTAYKYEIIPKEQYTNNPSVNDNHFIEISVPSGSNDGYQEITIKEDIDSDVVTGATTHTFTHGLGTTAVIVEVFEVNSNGSFTKAMPIDVRVDDKDTVSIDVDNSSKRYEIIVKKLSDTIFTKGKYDIVHDVAVIKLGDGSSTSTYNPMTTMQGVLQDEIDSSSYTPSASSIVFYDRNLSEDGSEGYNTYNIKITVDILESINITEAGLFDVDGLMLFYSAFSDIYAVEGTQFILYYEIEPTTLD